MIKNPLAMLEMQVRSLDWEDPLEKGNGNPLQYSCLENPMVLEYIKLRLQVKAQSNPRGQAMPKDNTDSLSHTRWNCKYHIVFAPKFRRQAV